jgi:type IV pilus assembly protein PilA
MLTVLKKQLKRNRKKGFTLVEVIVVLVILAILAAIAIPALTGYIDKANEKAVISQTRSSVVAAQTIVSDGYGEGETDPKTLAAKVTLPEVTKLSGDNSITGISNVTISGTAIYKLKVDTSSGKTGYYLDGKYSTTTPAGF